MTKIVFSKTILYCHFPHRHKKISISGFSITENACKLKQVVVGGVLFNIKPPKNNHKSMWRLLKWEKQLFSFWKIGSWPKFTQTHRSLYIWVSLLTMWTCLIFAFPEIWKHQDHVMYKHQISPWFYFTGSHVLDLQNNPPKRLLHLHKIKLTSGWQQLSYMSEDIRISLD